jgi:hypothetical protein
MRQLHIPTAVAALAAVLVVGGACGSSPPADGSSSSGARPSDPAPSVTPSPAAEPTPAPSAVTQPSVRPAPARKYPTTARTYAEAVIGAWQQDRMDVLGDLATSDVRERISEVPLTVNPDWTFMRCDATTSSSRCVFINAVGDLLTLRISRSLLGKAHAAIEVRLDVKA